MDSFLLNLWMHWWGRPFRIPDTPLVVVTSTEEWKPRNGDRSFCGEISLAVALENSRSVGPRGFSGRSFRLSVGLPDNQWPRQEKTWGPVGVAEGGTGQLEFWLYSGRWRPVVSLAVEGLALHR